MDISQFYAIIVRVIHFTLWTNVHISMWAWVEYSQPVATTWKRENNRTSFIRKRVVEDMKCWFYTWHIEITVALWLWHTLLFTSNFLQIYSQQTLFGQQRRVPAGQKCFLSDAKSSNMQMKQKSWTSHQIAF